VKHQANTGTEEEITGLQPTASATVGVLRGLIASPDPLRQLFCTPLHITVVSLMATKILLTADGIKHADIKYLQLCYSQPLRARLIIQPAAGCKVFL